ncbi:hypothetical protein LTS07_002398 [Exophiala sideris]|uniref:Uncharacterized protein n=1 Tax=Exophiala sideris TaxID=1016849 RepID=A0ABR0JMR6_9EURO|nr:hypothetical protein LTS07_002398 [Exophiala sideris]KAK5041502.1 hypothetical protein LTR13_002167 [Exophiala sideris]KAK5067054.1 hypothetical protein LTR69_002403 [Exophiala sideris]KAK5185112.1 hypothetical protein LTR44_002959 [Eurotiomycetes sp. CCFEE 6388]
MSATASNNTVSTPAAPQHELSDKFTDLNQAAFGTWLAQRSVEVLKLARRVHASIGRQVNIYDPRHMETLVIAKRLLAYAKALGHVNNMSNLFKNRISAPNTAHMPQAVLHSDPLQAMRAQVRSACILHPQTHLNQLVEQAQHLPEVDNTMSPFFCEDARCNGIVFQGIQDHSIVRDGTWLITCDPLVHEPQLL